MADNTRLSVGAGGDLIRTEDIGGSYKIAVSKIYIGAYGVDGGPVASDNPLPVAVIGTVNVAGAISVPGTVSVQGTVEVSNSVAVTVGNTVTVAGSIAVSNTVAVSGSVNVANTVAISGAVNVANTVPVTGSVNVGNTVTVAGTVNVGNSVGITGTVNVGNTVGVTGTVNVGNTVAVTGSVAVPGTVTVQGNVNALAVTGSISDGSAALTPKRAVISASSNGSNVLVPGVAGKRIRVLQYLMIASMPVTVEVRSGSTTSLTGSMSLGANGGAGASLNPIGHFETGVGMDLTLQLSSATSVGGHLTYLEV